MNLWARSIGKEVSDRAAEARQHVFCEELIACAKDLRTHAGTVDSSASELCVDDEDEADANVEVFMNLGGNLAREITWRYHLDHKIRRKFEAA